MVRFVGSVAECSASERTLGARTRNVRDPFGKNPTTIWPGNFYPSELLDADRDAPAGWELLCKSYSRQELSGAITRVLGSVGTSHR